jgi:sec-independent protein translocase protein TatA
MILMIGSSELLIIGLVILLLFGAKKIPTLMRDVGKGVREINKTKEEIKEELKLEEMEVVKNIKSIKDSITK